MGTPIFVARLRVTNGDGTFDSLGDVDARGERPRIQADIVRSLANEPNTANVRIYNLAEDTIAKITGTVRSRIDWTPQEREALLAAGASAEPVELVADSNGLASIELSWGYADSEDRDIEPALAVGFVGQSSTIRPSWSGSDEILTIEAEDSGTLLGAGEVVQESGVGVVRYRAKSYAGGTDIADVLVDLIAACGARADRDTLAAAIAVAMADKGLPAADTKVIGGYSASGPARPQVQAILGALGLRWSIQNGEFLVLGPDSVLPGVEPLELSTEAGNIIGQPRTLEANRLEIETWATASADPGRQVGVVATNIAASYRLDVAETNFDTYSGGSTTLKLDELQTIPGVF